MPRQVTVYDWYTEVEPLLIQKLGLTPDTFRDYSNLNDTRDWWHVFLCSHGEEVRNDSFVVLWDNDDPEYLEQKVRGRYGEWAVPLPSAMNQVIRDLTPGVDDPHIVVWFSW